MQHLILVIISIPFFLFSNANADNANKEMKSPIELPKDVQKDSQKNTMMKEVIKLADTEVARGGLPFATLIVNPDHEIVAKTVNTVAISKDPTDHAEIRAIRIATQKLGKSELHGHEVYIIGHPCPMCLAALMLAKPKKIYFAVTQEEKDSVLKKVNSGIDLYAEMGKHFSKRHLPMEQLTAEKDEALTVFKKWDRKNPQ